MAAFTPFDQQNDAYLAGLSYRKHRQLEFNPDSGQWEDSSLSPADYDKKYAANERQGSFNTFGTVDATGPDTSSDPERRALSPLGTPEFYGGTTNGNTNGDQMSLNMLRQILAQEEMARQKKGY